MGAEIRPIPGFDGYFAGSDGFVYRRYRGNRAPCTARLYLNIKVDGVQRRHPVAWFVARAWCDGFDPAAKMRAEIVNGDPLDTRPENLRWVHTIPRADPAHRRERALAVKEAMESDPADPRHGTYTGYRYGCKCARCRAMGPVVNRRNQIRKTMREEGLL